MMNDFHFDHMATEADRKFWLGLFFFMGFTLGSLGLLTVLILAGVV